MPARNIERRANEQSPRADAESREEGAPATNGTERSITPPVLTTGLPDVAALRDRKVAIRRDVRAALKKMRGRGRRSQAVCEAILAHPIWINAKTVAIFAPMKSEPDVELLWAQAEGKVICYPTIRLGGLDFLSVTGVDAVAPGPYGFREPAFDPSRVVPPESFDLVILPGSAFTPHGDRLGRGGGFYDRLLSAEGFRAETVGVCFDVQLVPTLPVEPHDRRVGRVVTESGWIDP